MQKYFSLFAVSLVFALCLLIGSAYNNNAYDYDASEIARLMEKAENGDAEAQTSLGFIYKEGWDVFRDYRKAAHYFKLATNQGDAEG